MSAVGNLFSSTKKSVTNINSNYLNSQNFYLGINSKEENQTLQRDDDLKNSNMPSHRNENNIINKNLINYDVFKNIPVYDNIKMKQKLMKQNSLRNPDLNLYPKNFNNQTNKSLTINNDFNNSEAIVSPIKMNIHGNNLLNSISSNDVRESNLASIDKNKTIKVKFILYCIFILFKDLKPHS